MRTLSKLQEFYTRYASKGQYKLKIITLKYYIFFEILSILFGRQKAKDITRHKLKISSYPVKVKLRNGLLIHCPVESYGVFIEVLMNDIYELKQLKKNPVVVDVGANIGLVSLLAYKWKNAKVTAFEPSSANYIFLSKNIKNNKANITLHKAAISHKKGQVDLFLHGSGTNSIMLFRKSVNKETVKLTTLDNEISDKAIDLLKIDVEGAELDVLKGAKNTLKNTKKIIIEYEERLKSEIVEILNKNNFKIKFVKNMIYAIK